MCDGPLIFTCNSKWCKITNFTYVATYIHRNNKLKVIGYDLPHVYFLETLGVVRITIMMIRAKTMAGAKMNILNTNE